MLLTSGQRVTQDPSLGSTRTVALKSSAESRDSATLLPRIDRVGVEVGSEPDTASCADKAVVNVGRALRARET